MSQEYTPPVSPAWSIATPSLITPTSSPSNSSWTDSDSSPSPSLSEHIKRPPNAFMIFRSAFLRSKQIPAEETNQQQTLSRIIGQTWHGMTVDEKAVYNDAADAAKREHLMRYPNYKYSPAASKVKSKAKMEKKIGKVSAEEVTRIRMQYTNVKGPVLSSPRRAKKARGVKANARAFAPIPEAVPATMGLTASVQHAPLNFPSGPFSFEPQMNAEVLQHEADVCNFLHPDYMQPPVCLPDPSFRYDAHFNNSAWGPASQPALPTSAPFSSFPAQQTGSFTHQPLSAYNNSCAIDTGSSSAIPSPISDYDCNNILSSPYGSVLFDAAIHLAENIAGLRHDDTLDAFPDYLDGACGYVNEGSYNARCGPL